MILWIVEVRLKRRIGMCGSYANVVKRDHVFLADERLAQIAAAARRFQDCVKPDRNA